MIVPTLDEIEEEYEQQGWPRIMQAQPIEDGQAIAVVLREFDGTISAVRIPIELLAD